MILTPVSRLIWHSWYCFNAEIVKNHAYIHYSSYYALYMMSPSTPSPTYSTWVYCFPESHVICCAELKIIFQPEALEWPYVLGERELAPRRGKGRRHQTSNHRPVLLLILLKLYRTLKKAETSFYTLFKILASHSTSTTGINGFAAFSNNVWPKHPEICLRACSQKDGEYDFIPNFPWLCWEKD